MWVGASKQIYVEFKEGWKAVQRTNAIVASGTAYAVIGKASIAPLELVRWIE